jgi:hypothetical protein
LASKDFFAVADPILASKSWDGVFKGMQAQMVHALGASG